MPLTDYTRSQVKKWAKAKGLNLECYDVGAYLNVYILAPEGFHFSCGLHMYVTSWRKPATWNRIVTIAWNGAKDMGLELVPCTDECE